MRHEVVASGLIFLALAACSGDPPRRTPPSAPAGRSAAAGEGGSGGMPFHNSEAGTQAPSCANAGANDDFDQDGYSRAQDDCNDCNASIHPGAAEVRGNNIDEDCNGTDQVTAGSSAKPPFVPEMSCDDALVLDSQVPLDGARAIGLCTGVVEARYSDAVGNPGLRDPLQVGLLERFGTVMPREGERLLLLSSGVARGMSDPGFTPGCDDFSVTPREWPLEDLATPSPSPEGYPKLPRAACGLPVETPPPVPIYDPAALSLSLQAPDDAIGFSVDFSFYTAQYPLAVCDIVVNDTFLILMDPAPPGADHGNIAFDDGGNPISVNTNLFRVCEGPPEPQIPTHELFDCSLGPAGLVGTGFNGDGCPAHDLRWRHRLAEHHRRRRAGVAFRAALRRDGRGRWRRGLERHHR